MLFDGVELYVVGLFNSLTGQVILSSQYLFTMNFLRRVDYCLLAIISRIPLRQTADVCLTVRRGEFQAIGNDYFTSIITQMPTPKRVPLSSDIFQ